MIVGEQIWRRLNDWLFRKRAGLRVMAPERQRFGLHDQIVAGRRSEPFGDVSRVAVECKLEEVADSLGQ